MQRCSEKTSEDGTVGVCKLGDNDCMSKFAHSATVRPSAACLSGVRVTYLYDSELVQGVLWGHGRTGMAR